VARSAFLYRGPAKAALRRLKLSGWRAVASALAAAMVSVNVADPDVVTWVPVSSKRRARRGYDQARALAVSVGERLGRPVERLLVRSRDGPPQASRSAAERRTAVVGSFAPSPVLRAGRAPPPARVLLVDDTLTTGATAGECASVLRRAGVGEVGLLTAARAIPGPLPPRCYPGTGSGLGPWLPGDHPR
jgi:predicted amidophosphoribosyltransferase